MKIKYILTVIAIVAITKNSFAQYAQDAIRFSTSQSGSTSRIKAIGNASTAVGGDLSSVSGNPAGLGFFTKSEFSFTPEYDGSTVKSTYLGQANKDTKNTGNLNNAAIVFYTKLNTSNADKSKGWLSLNFGAGYSRTNNYYENILYGGKNNNNSINDYYADQANQFGVNEGTLAGAAYTQFLINNPASGQPFQSNAHAGVTQANSINKTGGQSEINLSLGANYSNKLYLGLGIGMTDLRYNSFGAFSESGVVSETNVFTDKNYNSVFNQDQITRGSGFNAKFGVIYKPVEAVRLGAVFTTPTYYNIDDSYTETLSTQMSDGTNVQSQPQPYSLNYDLVTPLKVAGGLAVFIKQFGFISGDVEYIDYTTTHLLSSDSFDASFDNTEIKTRYQSAINAHVGAEARLNTNFFLRGGYGIQGNAMKENGSSIKTASGGIGFRSGSYYIDATYSYTTGSQTVFPYDIGAASPAANLNRTNNNVFLTIGFRY